MTENGVGYNHELLIDLKIRVTEEDIHIIDRYINTNKQAQDMPESAYAALAVIVSAYKGRMND